MRTVNLEEVMAAGKVGRTHIVILALCTFVMLIDGLDVFLIGKLAPAIADSFGLSSSAMTLVFVLQQAGLAAGAFVIGPLADRYGRRLPLITCIVLFSVFTLLTLVASTITEFAIYRAIAGLFLSGVIPNVVALLSEIAPGRARATFITIVFSGYSAGGMVASAFTATMLESHGWQAGFWIGGLISLALAPILLWYLPESAQFRANRNGGDPRIAATLRRIAPHFEPMEGDVYVTGAARRESRPRGNPFEIFRGPLALATILLWLSYFFALGNIALLGSWVATFFNQLGGVSLQDFALVSIVGFFGGLVGMLCVGALMDRFGHARVLPIIFLLNGASAFVAGYVPFGTVSFVLVQLFWYFCQSGGQAGLNAFAATYYPSRMRSTGVGWAFGAGRIGGVIAPVFGGIALSAHLSLQEVLAFLALPSVAVALFIFLLCQLRPSADQKVPAAAVAA